MATQRELREAHERGMREVNGWTGRKFSAEEIRRVSLLAYPPKMVTQPREEVLPGTFEMYRINGGRLEKEVLGRWHHALTDELQGVLDRLLANPTEEVEDDS